MKAKENVVRAVKKAEEAENEAMDFKEVVGVEEDALEIEKAV